MPILQPRLWQRGPVERQTGDALVRAAFDDDVTDQDDDVIEGYSRSVGAPDTRIRWRAVEPLEVHR